MKSECEEVERREMQVGRKARYNERWDKLGCEKGKGNSHSVASQDKQNVPSSKRFPTTIPAARKGLLLGMSTLMSLNMFYAPV